VRLERAIVAVSGLTEGKERRISQRKENLAARNLIATTQYVVTRKRPEFIQELVWENKRRVLRCPFDAHCCHMGTAVKHPVPDRVKPSFVIFDIQAL